MKINFIDLQKQYINMKQEIDNRILSVLESTMFIQGKEVNELDEGLAQYIGSNYAISCSSGTDALLLALMSIGVGPGDEVITTPFTFFATAEVISFLGAKPVFVDIDPESYNIDANLIERYITNNTKAIIPVSLYGQPADMDEINQIAMKHNLIVIEDAAQSFGAEYKGKKSGNLSTIGCTSFFPSKPLGCYGDGGAIFTNDTEIAEKARVLMNHGQTERYKHKYIGINGRLDAIQAAILNVKLKYFSNEVMKRWEIGQRYTTLLNSMNNTIITPAILPDRTSVYAQYSIRVPNREEVIKGLNTEGIPTAIHYPIPLYKQEVYQDLNINPEDYPVTEKVSKEIMSLPISPYLTIEEQDLIIEKLSECL